VVRSFCSVYGFFAQMERKKYKLHVRVMLSKYRGYAECPIAGQRLRAEARSVRINARISARSRRSPLRRPRNSRCAQAFPMQEEIAGSILERFAAAKFSGCGRPRIHHARPPFVDASGGEAQRIQLATSLGSRLVGALYVLDEPSIGLHTRDTARLIHILHELRDLGNTIIVVEHDADVLRAADHLLDLGPGAGELGGKLLARGSAEIEANPNS